MHKKTAELSYDSEGKDVPNSPWIEIKDKFCIPVSAGGVNVEWFNQYYNRYIKEKDIEVKSIENEINECKKEIDTITKTTYYPSSINTWNIHAETRNFGYFGWNIDISCFYALNRNTVDVCGNECIDKNECVMNIYFSFLKGEASYYIQFYYNLNKRI